MVASAAIEQREIGRVLGRTISEHRRVAGQDCHSGDQDVTTARLVAQHHGQFHARQSTPVGRKVAVLKRGEIDSLRSQILLMEGGPQGGELLLFVRGGHVQKQKRFRRSGLLTQRVPMGRHLRSEGDVLDARQRRMPLRIPFMLHKPPGLDRRRSPILPHAAHVA